MGQACCQDETDNDDCEDSFGHERIHDSFGHREEDYAPLHELQQHGLTQNGMTMAAFPVGSQQPNEQHGMAFAATPMESQQRKEEPDEQVESGRRSSRSGQLAEEFTISVDRTAGQRLGVDVRHEGDAVLVVKEVSEGGLFQQWNDSNPSAALKVGDRIVAANGVRESAVGMVAECEKKQVLEFKVQRPDVVDSGMCGIAQESREFTIHLEKDRVQDLGVDIDDFNFEIVQVTGGLVEAWNNDHPDMAVEVGDRIVEVNGKREIKDMVAECKQKKKKKQLVILDIVIKRDGTG